MMEVVVIGGCGRNNDSVLVTTMVVVGIMIVY